MKKVLEVLKTTGMVILFTDLGRLAALFVLTLVFNFLGEYYDWAAYVAMGCFLTIGVYVLVYLVFALVINPLREWKSRREK